MSYILKHFDVALMKFKINSTVIEGLWATIIAEALSEITSA